MKTKYLPHRTISKIAFVITLEYAYIQPSIIKKFQASKMKKEKYLKFDDRITYGTSEQFFHFMLGYMLPSLCTIINQTDSIKTQYIFYSCGPVMDKLIREVMSLYQFDYKITSDNSNKPGNNEILIPRWDIGLLKDYLLRKNRYRNRYFISRIRKKLMLENRGYYRNIKSKYKFHRNMHRELLKSPAILSEMQMDGFLNNIKHALVYIKKDIESQIAGIPFNPHISKYQNTHLLLARSPEPSFYSKATGSAKEATYGISRRSLINIEKTEAQLQTKGIPAKIFEPGKYSLIDQIKVYQSCRSIIGIKGAEFVNIIWMPEDSQIILIKPDNMNTPNVQKKLATLLGLKYEEIVSNEGAYPELDIETLENFF